MPCHVSLVWRGGAQQPSSSWHPQQPPPPPPPPRRQDYSTDREQHLKVPHRIPPPPPPPRPQAKRQTTQFSHLKDRRTAAAAASPVLPAKPTLSRPPRIYGHADAVQQVTPSSPLPPPRPPPPVAPPSGTANEQEQQTVEVPNRLRVHESSTVRPERRHETAKSLETATNGNGGSSNMVQASPAHFATGNAGIQANKKDGLYSTMTRTRPLSSTTTHSNAGHDIVFVVPPKEELNRISLQTALSGQQNQKNKQQNMMIHLGQDSNVAMHKLLASHLSVAKEMMLIRKLLQEMLIVQREQQDKDHALVLRAPRPITAFPLLVPQQERMRIRRRVEKVRKVPRKTILSSLSDEVLEHRDLTDGEFDALLQGLEQPSEAEEIYHEYEYDDEEKEEAYPWERQSQQQPQTATLLTPNAEEVNAFLRESSDESESLYSITAMENAYDSNMYYDDYYDEEPLDDLLKAWRISDAEGLMNDSSEDDASYKDFGHEDSLDRNERTEVTTSPTEDCDAEESEIEFVAKVDNASARRADPAPLESRSVSTSMRVEDDESNLFRSQLEQQQRPPPPPPRAPPPRNVNTAGASYLMRATDRADSVSIQQKAEDRKRPPPPPPRTLRGHSIGENSVLSPSPVAEYGEGEKSLDESDDFDEVELRLLEETTVNEVYDVEEDEDTVDEDDLRILQLSQWSRFTRNRGAKQVVEEDEFFVDDDVYVEETSCEDVTTDDFTDVFEDLTLTQSSLSSGSDINDDVEQSSEEDEMFLGESAIDLTHTSASFGQPRPPPPPPRPPQPSQHGTSGIYSEGQQQPTAYVQSVSEPDVAAISSAQHGTSPYSFQTDPRPPLPPTGLFHHPAAGYGTIPRAMSASNGHIAHYANANGLHGT